MKKVTETIENITRKEAELSGIIEATKILNNKLEQLERLEKDKILTDEIL